MPRSSQRVTQGPEGEALDRAAAAFDQAEKAYNRAYAELLDAMLAADAVRISKAEIGRRTGYTREHVSNLINGERKRRAEAAAAGPDHAQQPAVRRGASPRVPRAS